MPAALCTDFNLSLGQPCLAPCTIVPNATCADLITPGVSCVAFTPKPTNTPINTSTPAPTTVVLGPDGDGVADAVDNCPNNWNPAQSDADWNGIGDMCDAGFTNTPFVLQKVSLKAAGIFGDGHASMVVQGILDTTEWGGPSAFATALGNGFAVHVDGAGLLVPGETTDFAPCVSECTGSGAVAKFKQKRKSPNILTVKMTLKGRTFPPPLTLAPIAVTISVGGLDRRDQVGNCKVGRIGSTAKCRTPAR